MAVGISSFLKGWYIKTTFETQDYIFWSNNGSQKILLTMIVQLATVMECAWKCAWNR